MKKTTYIYMEDYADASRLAGIIEKSMNGAKVQLPEDVDWHTGKEPIMISSENDGTTLYYKIYFEEA